MKSANSSLLGAGFAPISQRYKGGFGIEGGVDADILGKGG